MLSRAKRGSREVSLPFILVPFDMDHGHRAKFLNLLDNGLNGIPLGANGFIDKVLPLSTEKCPDDLDEPLIVAHNSHVAKMS
jgi:hypothetical protein